MKKYTTLSIPRGVGVLLETLAVKKNLPKWKMVEYALQNLREQESTQSDKVFAELHANLTRIKKDKLISLKDEISKLYEYLN